MIGRYLLGALAVSTALAGIAAPAQAEQKDFLPASNARDIFSRGGYVVTTFTANSEIIVRWNGGLYSCKLKKVTSRHGHTRKIQDCPAVLGGE